MKGEAPKTPSPPDNDEKPKTKRPYRAPALESYGSVSGVTRGLLKGTGSKDTLIYSY